MKIISVVGARPNFMKIAPFCRAISQYNELLKQSENPSSVEYIEHILVHTGQHYDDRMSQAFFESLNIPNADINLNVHGGSNEEQIAATMTAFEPIIVKEKPDWVVVVGDVNATSACSQVASRFGVRVAHIEAGLRSYDMDMPEEHNRLVTDSLSSLLLTPDRIASKTLLEEGKNPQFIVFVGNIMIDTLEEQRNEAAALNLNSIIKENKLSSTPISRDANFDLENGNFAFATLHRPSNVDDKEILAPIIDFFCNEVASDMTLIWPVHPRTRKNLESFGIWEQIVGNPRIIATHPLNYHDLLRVNMGAKLAFTDSGGLQEECCVLGTPCLTLRWNTERPITLQENGGASILVGNNVDSIREGYQRMLAAKKKPMRPELWDGQTAGRCVSAIISHS